MTQSCSARSNGNLALLGTCARKLGSDLNTVYLDKFSEFMLQI